jgi:hypothetical protein
MKLIELRPYGLPSFDEAVPQGQPTVETPLQQSAPTHYVITQRYMQRVEAYKKPAENARMPREILPSLGVVAYHCYDGPRTPVNGSQIITFDRVWATVPSNFIDSEQITVVAKTPSAASAKVQKTAWSYSSGISYEITVTNLGIVGGGVTSNYYGYIYRDFFLVGSGGSYAYQSLIPVLEEPVIQYQDWSVFPVNVTMPDGKWNSAIDGLPVQTVPLLSGIVSLPSISRLVPGAPTTGQTYENTGTGSTQFTAGLYVSGVSKLARYVGNIWERRTLKVTI